MRINQNISAMNTHSRLGQANNAKSNSLARLSSGLRINKAGDDAAGLAISEKMRGQIGGLNQAVRNAQDGISLVQTAEGGLTETHSILNRMRELAVQASNDTYTDPDRLEIQKEIEQLSSEITRIATDTKFNGQVLLNGAEADAAATPPVAEGDPVSFKIHVGADAGQSIAVTMGNMDADTLKVDSGTEATEANAIDLKTQDGANTAITTIDAAITAVSSQRSDLGSVQNRLEHTINNLSVTSENLTAAESRIRDVDMAQEMMEFTKNNILSQAATSMLAQANQMPQQVLQLLQ